MNNVKQLGFVLIGVLVGVAGCGDDETGGGGSGGSGGSSTSTNTSTTTGTTTSTSSSSAGGGDGGGGVGGGEGGAGTGGDGAGGGECVDPPDCVSCSEFLQGQGGPDDLCCVSKPLSDDLFVCGCIESCAAECGDNACQLLPATDECNACLGDSCGAELGACTSD